MVGVSEPRTTLQVAFVIAEKASCREIGKMPFFFLAAKRDAYGANVSNTVGGRNGSKDDETALDEI